MVEERVENHDATTEEGKILRSMECALATHGIFDAAVASALVPLCADISPELSECLQRFRVKQAELVSELSRCTTRMNDLRKEAVEERKAVSDGTRRCAGPRELGGAAHFGEVLSRAVPKDRR